MSLRIPITVSVATDKDMPTIVNMICLLVDGTMAFYDQCVTNKIKADDVEHHCQNMVRGSGSEMFVAKTPDGCIRGVVGVIRRNDNLSMITDLFVWENDRRKGIGNALVDIAIMHIKDHYKTLLIEANVVIGGTPMGDYWKKKMGFIPVETVYRRTTD